MDLLKSISLPPLLPGTSLLAWRNLSHERSRFIITLVGIVFSVVLMGVQLGLLIGFCLTTSGIIDNTDADIWITPAGTSNVDIASRQATRWRQQALALPEVASADHFLMQFSLWRKPAGGSEGVMLVGFNLASQRGGPWNIVEGHIEDLQTDGAVMLDRLYAKKLGASHVGQTIEINSQRVRIVGFTQGVRTFTQTPYVFTTYRNAQKIGRIPNDETSYVLIKLKENTDLANVVATLRKRLPNVDVWSRDEWSTRTRMYWMLTTGAGAALLIAGALGLVVGIVIVGQTLYASTVDRLPEYATLRAMGAPNRYLYTVILKQALLSAVLGFIFGIFITMSASWFSQQGNVLIEVPWWAILIIILLTILMCLAGATASIRRVLVLDPSSVFK